MITFLYDGTLEGFLTAVFETYEQKLPEYRIRKQETYEQEMFGNAVVIHANKAKALRVWKGLQQRLTHAGLDFLLCASLSEMASAEDTMLGFIQYVFSRKENVESDYSNKYVLEIARISKMVHRERHRMKAFIRFQATRDGIYYAAIEPDFNVIPLIITHFKNRYADQRWLIYDLKRKYGIYYDLHTVENISLEFTPENNGGENIAVSFDEQEEMFQQLWRDYFHSVNISSRRNMRLHLRHVPRRYWKLLAEKY